MKIVNEILAMVMVINETGKCKFSFHMFKPSKTYIPLFSFGLVYLLFSRQLTEVTGIRVEQRNSPSNFKAYFLDSAHPDEKQLNIIQRLWG